MKRRISKIESIARAVIIHRGCIPLCQVKGHNYFFLPGGHIEFGETIEQTLARELVEEIGIRPASTVSMGILQNFFRVKGERYHELNFVHRVTLPHRNVRVREKHITVHWKPVGNIKKLNLKPTLLRREIPRWLKSRKFFFTTT